MSEPKQNYAGWTYIELMLELSRRRVSFSTGRHKGLGEAEILEDMREMLRDNDHFREIYPAAVAEHERSGPDWWESSYRNIPDEKIE